MENETQAVNANAEVNPNYWWVFLLQGIVAGFIGWMLLVSPAKTILTLVVFLGLYWLIAGIVEVIHSLFDIGHKGSKWGWELVGGLVGIVAGLIVLNHPLFTGIITPIMFMYIIAFVFVINGIIKMVSGSKAKEEGKYEWSWASFFLGLVYLIFGVVLLTSPVLLSTASVVFAAALLTIVGGIGLVIFAFKVKQEKEVLSK